VSLFPVTSKIAAGLETPTKTGGRKNLSKAETESASAERKDRAKKGDTTTISKVEKIGAKQPTSKNEDLDSEESMENQKGSKMSSKKQP
jgi:hypothetical protein